MFEVITATPLFAQCNLPTCSGIAFDGCHYYFSAKCQKKVIKLNEHFQCEEAYKTCRIYTSICYDENEGCFFATSDDCHSEIFKLNCCFEEIDIIRIEPFVGIFSGVSLLCEENLLLASAGNKVYSIDKLCPKKIKEIAKCSNYFTTGVTGISPCFLYHYINGAQKIRFISKSGTLLKEATLADGYIIEQILYKGRFGDYDYFQILTTQHGCYPYLVECKMEKTVLGELDECTTMPPCPCPPPRPRPGRCECCNKILESIALQETALAHILNAEGEKIQRAVADSTSICEMLEVNKEVTRTISYVTNLEQVLYSKLDVLRECCYGCFSPDCECQDTSNCKCCDTSSSECQDNIKLI